MQLSHITTLHDEIIARTQAFCNGDTYHINQFRWCLFQNKPLLQLIEEVEKNHDVSFSESKKEIAAVRDKKMLSTKRYALIIVTIYNELYKALWKVYPKTKHQMIALKRYDDWHNENSIEQYQAIDDIYTAMHEDDTISRVIIHGSCANKSTCSFSDIDCIVVLSDCKDIHKLIEAKRKIMRCRVYLDAFNPWNHHSFGVLTEQDLEFYRETYLPVETLKESLGLFPTHLPISVIKESKENEILRMEKLMRRFDNIEKHHYDNPYYLMDFIGSVLLLPTLYLARNKVICTKKESFTLIDKYLTSEERQLLGEIEQARLDWKFNKRMGYNLRKALLSIMSPALWKIIEQHSMAFSDEDEFNLLSNDYMKEARPLVQKLLKVNNIFKNLCNKKPC